MAKYKCIASGNVIEFTNQVDIDSMVGHEGYLKLTEEETLKPATPSKKTTNKTINKEQQGAD